MSKFLTEPECIAQRAYVHVPEWHKAGYTGRGLSVFCDDVDATHVGIVADIIQTILPDAKIYTGSIGYIQDNTGIKECNINCTETGEILPFDYFIEKYSIDLINNSTTGGDGTEILPIAKYMKDKIEKYNLIFCGSSGNTYQGETTQTYNGACIVVGSANLKNGKPVYGLKAIGENIDFIMFHGYMSGSSFSSPFCLALAGLLRSKFHDITQAEVHEYFRTHCEDVGVEGKDIYNGWGLPILGGAEMLIRLQIGNSTMLVDGVPVPLEQPPIIDKNTGRTLVPVRAIAEAFDANVTWDDKTKVITITK